MRHPPRLIGMVAYAPILYTSQSQTLLRAHVTVAYALVLNT